MKALSSMDLYYLTKEFKNLENNRIDNFYLDEGIFYIQLYVKGQGKKSIVCKVGSFIYLDKKKDETNFPSNFIQYMRKYVKSGYLMTVEQLPGERILKFGVDKKNEQTQDMERFYIFIELFGSGNVVLTNKELEIKNALIKRNYKDRMVRAREIYTLPPQKELVITSLDKNLLKQKLKEETELILVKFIALKFGTGGKYSEEICSDLGFDKDKKTNELTNQQVDTLYKKLENIVNKEISANIIKKDDKVAEFYPFKFSNTENEEKLEDFNSAVKSYFSTFKEKIDQREKNFEKELKKLQQRLKKQLAQVQEIKKGSEKFNEIGNKIYEHYTVVEELLNTINKISKEKGWDYVEQKIKETPQLNKIIKKLNYKNNEIILELE